MSLIPYRISHFLESIYTHILEIGSWNSIPPIETEEKKNIMVPNRSIRRLSLDMFQKSGDHRVSERGIFKYMDLRFPNHQSAASNDINEVECECCGLSEDCTGAYILRTRARFYGKWVCGLCSEAINEESNKLGGIRNIVQEEALHAHMNVCRAFNRTVRVNPAMSLAYAMTKILRTRSLKNT